MNRKLVSALLALAVLGTSFAVAEKLKLEDLKCVVSNKKINPDAKVEYRESDLYFCCPGCPGAFDKNKEKFAAKANHQIVATGQWKQEKCPFSGGKLNPDTAVKVAGVEVCFCCKNCKKKVTDAEEAKQVDMVFGEKPFEKGFALAKKDDG